MARAEGVGRTGTHRQCSRKTSEALQSTKRSIFFFVQFVKCIHAEILTSTGWLLLPCSRRSIPSFRSSAARPSHSVNLAYECRASQCHNGQNRTTIQYQNAPVFASVLHLYCNVHQNYALLPFSADICRLISTPKARQ